MGHAAIFALENVRSWHKADIPVALSNVRFRGNSGHCDFRAFERSSAVVLYPASGTDASARAREELRSPRKLPSLLLSPFRPLSQRLLRGFEPLSLDRCVAQIRKSTRRKLTPGNHIRPSAFKTWFPWLRTPIPLTPIGVVGAIGSLSDIGHEDREVCGSQRGARSLNDFCGERDGHYADRVFDFANSVLTARSNSKRRMARTAASGSSLVQFF